MSLENFTKHWIPIFSPLHCPECGNIIRGSMFAKIRPDQPTEKQTPKDAVRICEDCYRGSHYGTDSYVKLCKHSILTEVISPTAGRKICRCSDVAHFDTTGHSRNLFPVSKDEDNHRDVSGPGGLQCGLLKLGDLVADAKYDAMQQNLIHRQRPKTLSEIKRIAQIQDQKEKVKKEKDRRRLRTVTQSTLHDANRTPASGSTSVADEKEADKDIPFFFRKYTEKYPFGNVHMALRIGPLIIENGVAK